MQETQRFMSGKQVAKLLGIDARRVYAECEANRMPSVRLGRRLLIPRAYVDELVAQAFAKCGAASDEAAA